jgi:hypothetical protein
MIADRVGHGRTDPGKGGEVNDVDDPVGEMVLANVALAELHPIRKRELGLENVQRSDPVTGGVELADDVGSDQTGGTGDEN